MYWNIKISPICGKNNTFKTNYNLKEKLLLQVQALYTVPVLYKQGIRVHYMLNYR